MTVAHHYQKLQTVTGGSFQSGIENEKQTPLLFRSNNVIEVSFTAYGFKTTMKQNGPNTVLIIIFLLLLKILHITHQLLHLYNIMFSISTQFSDYFVG